MNIEQQVVSLELAIKLKSLNIKQESIFYYADGGIISSIDFDILLDNGQSRTLSGIHNDYPDNDINELYAAYTASELGEMIPAMINCVPLEIIRGIKFGDLNPTYCARYFDAGLISTPDENMANAIANMFIYLHEDGEIIREQIPSCNSLQVE